MENCKQKLATLALQPGFGFGGYFPKTLPDCPEIQKKIILPPENTPAWWMFQALLVSMENLSTAAPNPSVGCVIVKNGRQIAHGCTEHYGGRHAERVAFDAIANKQELQDCEVYVTLEPCSHTGKQPPCTELFKDKNIKKIYIATIDPYEKVAKKGIKYLQMQGIDIDVGNLFKAEAIAWNYPFFVQMVLKRPLIALKWAQTIDGCLADDNNHSQWISGPISRSYAHWLRNKYDAILVGAGTVISDTPSLDVRQENISEPRHPLKILFDPNGRCFSIQDNELINKLTKKTFSIDTKKVILIKKSVYQILLSSKKNFAFKNILHHQNTLVLTLNNDVSEEEFFTCSLVNSLQQPELSAFLGRPLQSIFVEGGPRLLTKLMKYNLFDIAHVFTAPKILGGRKNRILLPNKISETPSYPILSYQQLGDDILTEMVPEARIDQIFKGEY
ncbi:MAG: bifunctional diaminohydroxyphosphoribosylaminopyrimidine deaminase/5-amino-6-(5-phosphoribosylamino)uracil reductase RibD [Silvanigrellaceae bacterium]|nr:bifunctional diaminohydroxyphosphoribosylaminopyrimidine deaminase/5-amino-6-(5-phosphoribosylamino)uracil reductase RibD [Silvanigrellaceae bacterium]